MTFADFLILSLEELFLIFNQMLSIGSFSRHVRTQEDKSLRADNQSGDWWIKGVNFSHAG